MYGILLIIAVIFLSGLIAYLGDQIGMKVGKRRISLFGLRPKYTSIIITVLTGALIATLTITVILVTNNRVRQVIFNIQEVVIRLDELDQQLLLKDHELKDMKQEIETKGEELAKIQQQKGKLEMKLELTQLEFTQAKNDLQLAQNDVQALETNRQELEERIAGLNLQRQKLEAEINELNVEIDKVTENYQEAKNQANQFQAGMFYYMEGDIVYQRGDIIYFDVIQGGQSERKTIQDLTIFLQRANEEVKKRPVKINQESGAALRLQDEDIFNVARLILNMNKEKMIVNLVAVVNVPKDDWVYAKFSLNRDFIVFNKGELIADTIIDAENPPGELEQELEILLSDINTKAVTKGLLTDNKGSVGSIDFSQFYQLLKRIQAYQGRAKVEVYAEEDIWRENRLSSNLRFNIIPLDEKLE